MNASSLSRLVALASVALAVALPTTASADVAMVPPAASGAGVTITPTLPTPSKLTPMVTNQNGDFVCQAGTTTDAYTWTTTASGPASYAIGNCADQWHLHRTQKSDYVSAEGRYYDGGFLYGDFNGCGWIPDTNDVMLNGNGYTACSGQVAPNTFASKMNCSPGNCSDGTVVPSNGASCVEYANVRPWGTEAAADNIRTVTNHGQLLWRYITRTGGYVMVRDTSYPAGQGNWVFVPRGCLPATLPAGSGGIWNP